MHFKTYLVNIFKNNPYFTIDELDEVRKVFNQEYDKYHRYDTLKRVLRLLNQEQVITPVKNEKSYLIGYNSLIY